MVLIARSRDLADNLSTQIDALKSDPTLSGPSLVARAKPIFQTYRNGIADLQQQWNTLKPPSNALAFHQKATEYWTFELSVADRSLAAQSEKELASIFTTNSANGQQLTAEFRRLYQDLLAQ